MTEKEITLKTGYPDLHRLGFSAVVFFYFAMLLMVNLVNSSIFKGLYYVSFFAGIVIYYAVKRSVSLRNTILFAVGAAAAGACNVILIENFTWIKLLILILSFFFAVMMLDDLVDERVYLLAVYMNAAVVAVSIFLRGTKATIYLESSNNYISVHLLAPAVLYYGMLEARGKKAPVIPALVTWVLSLLAGGRGGLIACTILLGGILIHHFLQDETTRRERVILGLIFLLILIPIFFLILQLFVSKFNGLYVVERFLDKGLEGGGRISCWTEYIEKTFTDPLRVLFGTPLSDVKWAIHYKGNLHNSYLFVHAYTGLAGFLFLVVMLIRGIVLAIRNKKWIYLSALLAFMFRGLTDHVFGGNRMSVVILALIFLPELFARNRKSGIRNTE